MTVITLGRLALGPPGSFVTEPVGDPVGSTGGAVVAAPRTAQQIVLDLNTILSGGSTLANAQTVRRQLRSMLQNTSLKMQAFLYLVYTDDVEQNGWLIPQPANITSPDNNAWKAVGLWEIVGGQWYLAGRKRGMREARSIWMKDLRSSLFERDTLLWILSSDFAALAALPLSILPNGATQIENAVNGLVASPVALPTGRDGGVCQLVAGPLQVPTSPPADLINPDLAALGYERAESALNLSDVIVYDRRGQITAPSTGPDTSWEEVYGPDYPWNWTTGGANDVPVLDNGLVRVRYDSTNTPGFRVEVWTGAAYVEQGKMIVERIGDTTGYDDTWVAASLYEYTPDRATILCVLSRAADPQSRERVYVTLERGGLGVTFEAYPALTSAGNPADVVLQWTPALNAGVADLNNSAVKIDSQGTGNWVPGAAAATQNTGPTPGVIAGTAGTGAGAGNSGLFAAGPTTLGAANFTSSENWVGVLRYPTTFNVVGAYQTSLLVLQAASAIFKIGSSSTAYGTAQDTYQVSSQSSAGYIQCQVQFGTTVADQVLEAESMTLGANTASTVDAAASGGSAATATRITDANAHVTRATWPNGFLATYRVFARVKVSAASASFYAKTGATTGATVVSSSTTYRWVDLGEITANNTTLEIHAWMSGGAGTVSVDRVEALLVQDRARTSAIYSGSRDAGQSVLVDSRTIGALVAR